MANISTDFSTWSGTAASNQPDSSDSATIQADLQAIQAALRTIFPSVNGAVTPTHTELNYVDGVTSAIQTQFTGKAASGANSDITSLIGLTTPLSSGQGGVPAGTIITYAGASLPTGYLDCDGSAVSRATYAALFTAIGTLWGSGDGSTTFNIPSIPAGEALVGSAGTIGASTTGQVQTHTHGVQQGLAATSVGGTVQGAGAGAGIQTGNPSTGTSTKNLAAGRYVFMCIKY